MGALHRAGFANRPASLHAQDGLELRDAYITAAVRCAPPQNRPSAQERRNCAPYFAREIELLADLRVVLALGQFAFDAYRGHRQQHGADVRGWRFRHGGAYGSGPRLVASYHPSQRNTQTGLLTPEMLDEVMATVRASLPL